MFQDFLIRRMLRAQGLPPEQVDLFLGVIKKNPELFQKIAAEIKIRVDNGEKQQAASMAVMQAHAAELKAVLGNDVNPEC